MAGDGTTFTGNVTSARTSYQFLTSMDAYEAQLKFACFTKNNLTRVIGAEAFGVESLRNLEVFAGASPTGRIIRYDSGKYQVSGPVFTEGGSAFYVGRMGSHSPHLTEGGDEWAYSWHDLNATEYAPVPDVEDNGAGHIDILMHKQQAMMNTLVNEFNYALLGNSSGASYGVLGPSAVQSDMPHLISVTQTSAVTAGGISAANAYWMNRIKQLTSVGGGGEFDRPTMLYRALQDVFLDTLQLGEATGPGDYMLLTTQGGYQLYDRLQFADSRQVGALTISTKYDPAGVKTFAFMGAPIIWDPATATPTGASSTSTEVFYGIHIPSFAVSIRKEGNFKFTGWERPRTHDQYKTMQAAVRVRFTPMVTARRPHFVLYDIPQCQD